MGCGISSTVDNMNEEISAISQRNGMTKTTLVEKYVNLDLRISAIENMCPGPRLATAEAWVDHLQNRLNNLQEATPVVPQVNGTVQLHNNPSGSSSSTINVLSNSQSLPNGVNSNYVDQTTDIARLALNLSVLEDVSKASSNEDFFAKLSQTSLDEMTIKFYEEVIDHAKDRAKGLLAAFTQLSDLYVEQDGIIASISGGTYLTTFEEATDGELENARDVRDKLGSAKEQWRTCAVLLKASSKSAEPILKMWSEVYETRVPRDKIGRILDCRQMIQASLVSLECAQLALPHIEIKHLSNRQILAVKHANTYLVTDVADKNRFDHTYKILEKFVESINKASEWIYETFNKTLKVDFDKAEATVQTLAETLREHRVELFKGKLPRRLP